MTQPPTHGEEELERIVKEEYERGIHDLSFRVWKLKDFFRQKISEARAEGYDEGAMEATHVCNEKTIPLAVAEARKQTLEEVAEMIEKMNNFRQAKVDHPDYEKWNDALNQSAAKVDALVKEIKSLLPSQQGDKV